jgi:D-serine deaminase-like pyridoxal phosphate-dependent protein
MQLKAGAKGVLVSNTKEADVAKTAGCKDITFAYPQVQTSLFPYFRELIYQVELTFTIDHIDHIKYLKECFSNSHKAKILIKIDSGLHRLGILPTHTSSIRALMNEIDTTSTLQFDGFSTHAGHVYSATNTQEVGQIAKDEQHAIRVAQNVFGPMPSFHTSAIGSTPTILASQSFEGITEIRPGNYVFLDRTQIFLGVASVNQCALRVRTSVLSRPSSDRIIIDAGSKQLSLDKGAHGTQTLQSFGLVVEEQDADLYSLSEEVGWVRIPMQSKIKPGDILHIVPNHACATASCYRHLRVVDKNGKHIDTWDLDTGNP